MATSRRSRSVWPVGAVLLVLLGCGGSKNAGGAGSGGNAPGTGAGGARGGQGGTVSATTGAGAGASAGSTTGPGSQGGSSIATAPRGGSAGNPGGASGASTAGGGQAGSTASGSTGGATGGTTNATGGGGAAGGSGGALGTGGRTQTSGRDAGVEVGPDRDAAADVAIDRPAGDAASIPGTNNPVLAGLFADPNLIVFDDTFYLYPTTDGIANWGATSFSAFSSKNLVQWTNAGVILDVAKELSWGKGRAWAPTMARVGDTYYFYFSADTQIGVATSKSPTGPFKDALGSPLVKAGQYAPQAIDPYVFLDDDGTRYLYFGSGSGGLRAGKLNADMISFASTPTNVSPSGASGTLEGSGMFKRKGDYYLYWSEGDTRNASYRMAYARAQSALGPFTRLATILEQSTTLGILGPGGGTILPFPARDEFYLAYHRFKIPGGDGTNRETCIDRVVFNSDGTIAPVKPTLAGLQAAVQP